MADRHPKKTKRPPASTTPPIPRDRAPRPLAECEALFRAIGKFVQANCNFESSVPFNLTVDELAKCTTLNGVFAVPLQRQVFSLDAALLWILFLTVAPEHAAAEGDDRFSGDTPFAPQEALALLPKVYDLGVQDVILEHFEDDEDDDEDEDEDGEADGAGEKGDAGSGS